MFLIAHLIFIENTKCEVYVLKCIELIQVNPASEIRNPKFGNTEIWNLLSFRNELHFLFHSSIHHAEDGNPRNYTLFLYSRTPIIKNITTNRSRELILPTYSALVKSHLEYCIQFWVPWYKKDRDLQETKMIKGL